MGKLFKGALLGFAVFAVPMLINRVVAMRRRALEDALPGDSGEYNWPLGAIHYQVRGEGTPLVLVHGIGAGESSYEWRHNFDILARTHRVYALDLPGFGQSERRNITYTADLYVTALVDFLRDIVGEPATVIASSLSSAYAVKVAAMRPELVERLILLCPTGLETLQRPVPVAGDMAFGLFSIPAIGTSLYNGIASYRYIESYLREHVYVDPELVTPALVEHYYQQAHRDNAEYVLRSFVAGRLSCDITESYPNLHQPIFICWGRHARPTPVENAKRFLIEGQRKEANERSTVRLRIFEKSGLLPNDEEWEDFNAAVLEFLADTSNTNLKLSVA